MHSSSVQGFIFPYESYFKFIADLVSDFTGGFSPYPSFSPDRDVLGPGKTYDFPNINEAYCSPLAKRIFSVSGVEACFLGPDFITVIKYDDDESWQVLKPELYAVIADFFNTNLPIINEDAVQFDSGTQIEDDDAMNGFIIF